MIAVQLQFLTGKLHATPWARQVNEGAIEWPPSQWRFLRALTSVWHNKFPDEPAENVAALLEQLNEPPSFQLPPTSQGHTRHYMPTDKNPAKIFDTFLLIPKSNPLVIAWPDVELEESRRELLARLLSGLAYFGRAESWVEAELLAEDWSGELNAEPLAADAAFNSDQQLERLLATCPVNEYLAWRTETIGQHLDSVLAAKVAKAEASGKPTDKVKLTAGDKKKVEASIPDSIFSALHAETNDLRKAGWNRPPGSRWVDYVRPANVVATNARSTMTTRRSAKPTVARYAVTGRVVPRLTDALRIGERARRFLMGCSKRANEHAGLEPTASSVFSGKTTDGSRLQESHQHAHYLCEASREDNGRISHLTVFAPMGFEPADEAALARFTRTWGDAGHDLQFVLLGIGGPADFGGTDTKTGQSPVLASTKHWISRTPFVPSRHLKLKRSEKNDETAIARELEAAIRLELERRNVTDSDTNVAIEPLLTLNGAGTSLGGTWTPWLKFVRERKQGGGTRAGSHGYGFRLNFTKEITGPIALGYGSHLASVSSFR